MSVGETIEAGVLRAAMALPESVQRLLAGRAVVIDGQTLAADLQLMLRLQRLARMPRAENLPFAAARKLILRQSRVVGAAAEPIGGIRELQVAGRPARLYTPTDPGPGLMVFFHGGGFVYGDLDSHDASCRFYAERSGARVLAVDYRTGPEHPFPAAYDDAVAAYEWTVDNAASLGADSSRLAVGGDSAGATLATVTAIEAARRGWPLAFQMLVYPTTDFARDTRSLELFGEGFYLTKRFMQVATEGYLPRGMDLRDPRVSPLYADLPAGLAPAFLATAGFDPLRDEGEAYARKMVEAGVTVELKRFPDQIHSFFNLLVPGSRSRAANAEIAVRLRAALQA